MITPLSELNDPEAQEDDPTLRQDELEIYFASTRYGSEDVLVATRSSTAEPFGVPLPVPAVDTGWVETTPELSPDGLVLLFASNRSGDMDVYYTTRASLDLPWIAPLPLDDINTITTETAATIQADGTTIHWCSDRMPSRGGADLWQGTWGGGTVGGVSRVLELSTPQLDCPGNGSDDMAWLFIESGREGSLGQHDIWVAQRLDDGTYDEPINVLELNTTAFEADPWTTGDLQAVYFASDRAGTYDLYVAR